MYFPVSTRNVITREEYRLQIVTAELPLILLLAMISTSVDHFDFVILFASFIRYLQEHTNP